VYLKHFNLREYPFSLTPSTRFLYWTESHRLALEHLLYGIRQRKGFMLLTGEIGSGKTTLCRKLLDEVDSHVVTALVLNPVLSEPQFLRLILGEFGITDVRGDRLRLRERLDRFLLQQAAYDRDVVLIIDEAQNLSPTMEHIRLLSNLETEDRKLLQIVLVGQPELRTTLQDPRLLQLRQRITVRYHLGRLSRQDTGGYLHHRLQTAGANGTPRFDNGSIDLLHRFSEGIPRRLSAAADMALLAAYSRGWKNPDQQCVQDAIRDLEEIG